MFKAQAHQCNTISREARAIQISRNTRFSVQYISETLDSWQAHLQELSCYLIEGEGAWWKWDSQGEMIEFLDANENVYGQPHECPNLENYRLQEM